MNPRRRLFLLVGAVLFILGCTGIILRTMLRQSLGPIRENFREADRVVVSRYPAAATGTIEGNGMVEPAVPEMRLTTDLPGRIAAIYVKDGEEVVKGAILAEIDNVVQRAQIAKAEAEIAAASAELQRAMHGMRTQDVSAIVSEAVAAKARAALAASEMARNEELVGKGTIATAELEMSKRRAEAETAAALAAQERAQGARAGSRSEDILVAQARVNAATAALEEARGALARTQIVAPRAGRILRLKFHVGEYHNPAAEPLLILGDVTRLRVRIDVDERDIARLKLEAKGWVTAPAFGTQKFPGRVVEISRHMGRRSVRTDDPRDRVDVKVLEAELELEGAPPLVTGMRVSAFVNADGT
jgi:multidrug resistance efflux pump